MKIYKKLVRDRIPEIMLADNEQPTTRILNDEEYLRALVNKLGEEYDEFKEALSLKELSDLQEIILALADTIGSREELEAVRAERAEKRGAFTKRIFLESGEDV